MGSFTCSYDSASKKYIIRNGKGTHVADAYTEQQGLDILDELNNKEREDEKI